MDAISVSSNHAVALGRDGLPYSWGFNNMTNRLGYDSSRAEANGREEPVVMQSLFKMIEKREFELHVAHMNEAHVDDPNAHGDLNDEKEVSNHSHVHDESGYDEEDNEEEAQ